MACMVTETFETKVILNHMRQLFIPWILPTWVIIALAAFFRPTYEKLGKKIYFLYVIPFFVVVGDLMALFGLPIAKDWIFYDIHLPENTYGLLLYQFGPVMKFNFFYLYFQTAALYSIYFVAIATQSKLRRTYALLLALGTTIHLSIHYIGRAILDDTLVVQLSVALLWPTIAILYYVITRLEFLDVRGLALQRVFEQLPNPVITIDPQGCIWEANGAARNAFKLDNSSLGLPAISFPALSPLLKKPDVLNLEDKIFHVHFHKLPLKSLQRNALVFVLSDISGISRLNEELVENNQMLKELNQHILRITDFNRKVQSIISHDLTGSLSGVRNLLLGLKKVTDERKDSQVSGYLENALEASSSSLHLLQDILAWSHTEESQHLVNVQGSLNSIIRQLSPQILQKEIHLHKIFKDNGLHLSVSQKMLEAVFRNLLANAIKYSPPQGSITVTSEIQNSKVVITFIDSGKGMSPETIQSLLNQDYKRTDSDGDIGLGLGLKFSFDFIKQMKGEILIESTPGFGSSFTVLLPLPEPHFAGQLSQT